MLEDWSIGVRSDRHKRYNPSLGPSKVAPPMVRKLPGKAGGLIGNDVTNRKFVKNGRSYLTIVSFPRLLATGRAPRTIIACQR